MRKKRLSRSQVVENARRQGLVISPSYMDLIENDKLGQGGLGVKKAHALAVGLGVPLMEVINAALALPLESKLPPQLEQIAALYESMNKEQRKYIEPFLEMIAQHMERTLQNTAPPKDHKT